ncbi:uncharacterized protein SCHCODRAFT_02614621 [Schizophyllum commune H4-8]|nr:uncharacterized protein SCHCODRAFT_02614621 [Schizophyllum commune H4-8]KAI5896365.1 hypothetical protein SCHCODRAFT_02614621 [Schizophyllum commune H4-8]
MSTLPAGGQAALASEASTHADNGPVEQSIPIANVDTTSNQQVLEMLRAALAGIAQLQTTVTQIERKVGSLEGDVRGLHQAVSHLESSLLLSRDDYRGATDEVLEAVEQAKDEVLDALNEAKDDILEGVEERKDEVVESIEEHKDEIIEAVNDVSSGLEEVENYASETNNKVGDIDDNVAGTQSSIDDLQSSIESLQSKLDVLLLRTRLN